MMLPPREPQSGDKITANWARDVVRYLKAITPMPGKGCHIDRKPTGSFIAAAGGAGGGGGSSSPDNGCFKIIETDRLKITFSKCIYAVAGRVFTMGSTLPDPPYTPYCTDVTLSESGTVVCLSISATDSAPAARIECWASIEALVAGGHLDPERYVIPLYAFSVDAENEKASLETDLRNIPTAAMFEFGP